jgi:hypothetical protein
MDKWEWDQYLTKLIKNADTKQMRSVVLVLLIAEAKIIQIFR